MSEQLALIAEQEPQRFPLTEFIVALFRMTPEQRMAADPKRAAERYGLPLPWCEFYINQARRIG